MFGVMTLGIQCVLAVLAALSHSQEDSASHLLNRVSLILLQFRKQALRPDQ